MGRMLILPRTHEQIDRVARYSLPERVPDFAARLHLWRQADAERRTYFRYDIHEICQNAAFFAALEYAKLQYAALEPPQEGA